MTKPSIAEINDIFAKALDCPIAARAELLDQLCGEDRPLRDTVEELLRREPNVPDAFLHQPPAVAFADETSQNVSDVTQDPEDGLIGRRIGRYTPIRLLGRGGMGSVYLALQEEPHRHVALKIMGVPVPDAATITRFRHESELLGRLRHPNVAHVYEAASVEIDGHLVPYFAMEYLADARPITVFADDKGLDIKSRLRLILQVCSAIHYGHQRGVIHRDIKPANLLIDADECAKVIDFGVARACDADMALTTMHTCAGALVGTIQYMSPEQCNGDVNEIDTRSDVYSLGVVLYELLTGRLPYDLSHLTIHAATRVICEQAPAHPARFTPRLRGDLATILLKALEKDRDRRYQSAGQLADELRRFLAGESIDARPPTRLTRAMRWVARHPAMSSTMLGITIAAATVAGTLLGWNLSNNRPFRVRWSSDGSEARLTSFGGKILRTWSTGHYFGQSWEHWPFDQPPTDASQWLFSIGFHCQSTDEYAGGICVFDLNRDYHKPLWHDRVTVDEIPPYLAREKYFRSSWVPVWCRFDLFKDVPGDEVVAVHVIGDFSPRCLRAYEAQTGRLLYEIWHDGSIEFVHHMNEAGLLVCAGDDARVPWNRRVGGDSVTRPSPRVIFALRPELGFISKEFVKSEPGDGDPLSPTWYRCLLPPHEGTDLAYWRPLRFPTGISQAGQRVLVSVGVQAADDKIGGTFRFEIDASGNEVAHTRIPEGSYSGLKDPPDYRMFYLGDLPPTIRGTTNGTAASNGEDILP